MPAIYRKNNGRMLVVFFLASAIGAMRHFKLVAALYVMLQIVLAITAFVFK